MQGNSCVVNACTPNQSYEPVSCQDEIPYSLAATRTKTCNYYGNDYEYSVCILDTCQEGYMKGSFVAPYWSNNCVPRLCTPNQTSDIDCKHMVTHSTIATMTRTCNLQGTDYLYGSCILQSCESGYTNQGNWCAPIVQLTRSCLAYPICAGPCVNVSPRLLSPTTTPSACDSSVTQIGIGWCGLTGVVGFDTVWGGAVNYQRRCR